MGTPVIVIVFLGRQLPSLLLGALTSLLVVGVQALLVSLEG